MSLPLELLIYERPSTERPPQYASTLALRGRTELGRQETTAEALYSSSWRETERYWRVVIARGTEQLETLRFEALNPTFLLTVTKPVTKT